MNDIKTVNVHDLEEQAARRALEAAAQEAECLVVGKPAYLGRPNHKSPKIQSLSRLETAAAIRTIDPAQFRTDRSKDDDR